MELQFHGAAQTVTGSMHILHLPGGPICLDCGLFQGSRAWSREMNKTWPIDPTDLRAVVLTHAHIDHCGKLPQLCGNGFSAPIHATSATCDLGKIMLADAAHIQEEDADYWNRKRAKTQAERIEPLYTVADAHKVPKLFRPVAYDQPVPVADGCTVTFLEAGHILGSTCVLVELGDGRPVRLLYTGDLGRFDVPILRDPASPLPQADYLITESTYAGAVHENAGAMTESLARIITETRQVGGKTIIPAFSLGRTQNVVYALAQAIGKGLLEPLPIFVDSPLSVNVTKVFRKHPECYDEQARDFWRQQGDVFGKIVTYITNVEHSKALHGRTEPCVIISGSGMCEHGRILHHLKNNVEDPRNTVIIVGYMARNTLGRRIFKRHKKIRIFGMEYNLLARVEVLNGFSSHADANDFARLLGPLARGLKAAFVVHGEDEQLEAMKALLTRAGCNNVRVPAMGERFEL
jgi:metallo-beta-lactamase family protein